MPAHICVFLTHFSSCRRLYCICYCVKGQKHMSIQKQMGASQNLFSQFVRRQSHHPRPSSTSDRPRCLSRKRLIILMLHLAPDIYTRVMLEYLFTDKIQPPLLHLSHLKESGTQWLKSLTNRLAVKKTQ